MAFPLRVYCFTFDYNPQQEYPMILALSKTNKGVTLYVNPVYAMDPFNVTYFTSLGYFVLLPDIVYEIGIPDIRLQIGNCSYQKCDRNSIHR
jgi:hypothetical protein